MDLAPSQPQVSIPAGLTGGLTTVPEGRVSTLPPRSQQEAWGARAKAQCRERPTGPAHPLGSRDHRLSWAQRAHGAIKSKATSSSENLRI